MKLKKILCIAFAVLFVVAASAIAIHAAHIEDTIEPMATCCSNYRGTSVALTGNRHDYAGYGCIAEVYSYCASCGTIFDTWTEFYNDCPHD